MKALIPILLVLLASGCAAHARKVDCERHLQAINPPNPVAKPATAGSPP